MCQALNIVCLLLLRGSTRRRGGPAGIQDVLSEPWRVIRLSLFDWIPDGDEPTAAPHPQSTSPRILAEPERGNVVNTLLGRIFKRKDTKKDTDPPNAHSSEAGDVTYLSCMGSIFKRKGTRKTAVESVTDTSPTLKNPARDNSHRRETEGPSTSQVATSVGNSEEILSIFRRTPHLGLINSGGSKIRLKILHSTPTQSLHLKRQVSTSAFLEPTTSVKDSIVWNLTTILNVIQQVGKILQSVPFVEPVGTILAEAVTVYKEVEDNGGKQDTLSKQVNTLNQHLEKATSRLEDIDPAEPEGNVGLASDVNAYMNKLKEVKQLLTHSPERGWFMQTVQRGDTVVLGQAWEMRCEGML
ncbi:hypothetical protein C8R43DRAFT_953606 [Mycena crocata]|nr:hypothetical protein C8R43DRAFT_953606 [Mycena crocata]